VSCNVAVRYIDVLSMEDTGTAVVAKAFATNMVIMGLKALAGWVTSSPSLLAEAAHSLVDSSTEVILLGGGWHAQKWNNARYFWGLVASVNMFAIGGLYAIYTGYVALTEPAGSDTAAWLGFAVLAVSAALEASSWVRAVRTLAAERGDLSWYRLLRTTRSTEVKAVVVEDSADLLGCVLAAAGLALRVLTGSNVGDGIASILIGCLLIGMAYELGAQNFKLLVTKEVTA
jgi:cation diffusion facilitator family transporter